jgi:hypothetical protein
MDPDANGFYLMKIGEQLPPNREIWTDSKSIMVLADMFIESLYDIMGRYK